MIDTITEKEYGVLEMLLCSLAKSDCDETLTHRRTGLTAVLMYLWNSERIATQTRMRYEKRMETAEEIAKKNIRKKRSSI